MSNLTNLEIIDENSRKIIKNFEGKKAGEVKVLLSFINAQHSAETDIDFISIQHDKKNKLEIKVYDYSDSQPKVYKENTKEFNNMLNLFKEYGADVDKLVTDLNAIPKVKPKSTFGLR